MLQNIRDNNPDFVNLILRRIVPVIVVAFAIYSLLVGIAVYSSIRDGISNSHEQAIGLLQAQLITEINLLLSENDDAANTASLRSQAEGLLANDQAVNAVINNLFTNVIRLNPSTYLSVQYITSNGVVLNEVVNDRGTPSVLGEESLPRSDTAITGDVAFLSAIQAASQEDSYFSEFSVLTDGQGEVVEPLQATFSIYVPIFDLVNPREPLGTVRFVVSANSILNVINNPLLSPSLLEESRQFFMLDEQGRIIADSNSQNQDFLLHLSGLAESGERSSAFHNQVENFVSQITGEVTVQADQGTIYTLRNFNTGDSKNHLWRIVVTDPQSKLFVSFLGAMALIIVVTIVVVGLVIYFIARSMRPVLEPIMAVNEQAQKIASGSRKGSDVTVRNVSQSNRTVAPISGALESLAGQIEALTENMESRSRRYNRDMQIIANIGRETATLYDINSLMQKSIELICNELGFYHAQIFLVDDVGLNAVLVYSRGEAGQRLLDQNHQLAVGSNTVIGTVTSKATPVIVNDTTGGSAHGFNPNLPDTRAEMGLPLIIGTKVLGVLDIQSTEPNVFHESDLPTFQLVADQLAVAIYNAQLRTQSDQRIDQINTLNRQLTRDAWRTVEQELNLSANYTYNLIDVNNQDAGELPEGTLAAPIVIRGETIGTLNASPPEGLSFSEGDWNIIRTVADRVALAIENARLFQETQITLSETEILYQLSRKLSEASSFDDIISAIIESVVTDASSGQIWIFDNYPIGQRPEWAELVTSSTEALPTDDSAIEQTRTHLGDHSIFSQLRGNSVVTVEDVRKYKDADDNFNKLLTKIRAKSVAFIPLNVRGIWRGFIAIYFGKTRLYTDREHRIYTALIDQAGVAIDNRLLLEQTENALQRNEKLYASSRIINTAQSLEDLVYAALASANTTNVDFWLGLFESSNSDLWNGNLQIVARSEMGVVEKVEESYPVNIPESSPMRNREPEIITDNKSESWMWDHSYAFVSAFPLFSDAQPIALFFIVSYEDYALSQEDYEVYRALTGQMSTQIQNSRLLQQTELALAETQRLYIASRAIAGAQDTDSIFESASGHLALPFLQSGNDAQIDISIVASHPYPTRNAPELNYRYRWVSNAETPFEVPVGTIIPNTDTPFASVLTTRNPSVYYRNIDEDLADNPTLHAILSTENSKSAVISVLQTRQNWYGVLICRGNQLNMFDDRYVDFVQAVANQVAIGIENQELFDAAQSERERLQTILSTLPTGIIVLEPITYVPLLINDSASRLLGREIDFEQPFSAEYYQLYRTGTNLLYPDDELPVYAAAEAGESIMADDVALIRGNYQMDLLLNAAPIFDPRGNITAIVAAFQDISNLRSLENTLQENLRETVSLYETQRSLAQADSLDDLLDAVLVQLVLMQPDDAFVFIKDDQTDELTVERQLVMPMENPKALQSLLPMDDLVNIEDVSTLDLTPEAQFELEQINAQSLLILALRVPTRDEPLGWLMLTSMSPNGFSTEEERLLVSLGDMTRTALDNRYLVQSTQTALQETRSLYAATTNITRASDLFELGDAIEQAVLSLNPDVYACSIRLDANQSFELFKIGLDEAEENGLNIDTLFNTPLQAENNVYVSDITRSTLGDFEQELLKAGSVKKFIAVNLRVKDSHGGRILIGFNEDFYVTDGSIRFLNAIADSAAVVIDNQVLLEQIQSTLQETSVLYQSSRALTDAQSTTDIIDVVVNYLIGPHVNQVFVALLNNRDWSANGASVEIEAGWQADDGVDLQGVTLSADQFPAWEQLSSQVVLTINDIYDEVLDLDIMQRTSIESLDTRSLVIIPLRVSNRSIGSIWIGSREPYSYTDTDARIFQAFAESASLSLEASYLFAQTEHRARQLETSAEVGQSVGQILDLNILLPQVVDLIRDRFGYDHVQIFLMGDRNEYAELKASTGEAGRQLLAINHKLARGSDSVIGRVTSTGEPTIALDTADANVVHQPNAYLPLTRSEMALPLIVKNRVVGALDVQSNQPNAFSDEDIRALTTLSAQIAIAIDNANLYEELARRATDMGLLFDITTLATSAQTLDEALQLVTDRLMEAFYATTVVFYLPQLYVDHRERSFTMLKPTVLSGLEQPIAEISEIRLGDSENLIGIVGSTQNAQVIKNINSEVRYLSIAQNSSSAMLVPVTSGGRLSGLIAIEHRNQDAFTQDDLQVVITLAGSLAAVIDNTTLVEQLQKTNEQLREVDRLKSQFLANMSHELRTPLNSIIGFSRVMLKGIDGALTEMQEQDLTTIYNSGQHLLNLINDILDQAKIESGKMDLKFAYFGIKPLIESVRSIGIGLVKEKSIDLVIDIESGMPQAYGDEFRTRQILLNIVSNATKFTPEGSITIRAYTIFSEELNMQLIRIDIIDTGIGIDQKDIPLLFETFRQVDSSLTRTVGGTGLGLPLSKSLAEMQGGELLVESEVGVGSTFSVTIPIEPIMGEDEDEDSEDDVYDTKPDLKPDTQSPQSTMTTVTTNEVSPETSTQIPIVSKTNGSAPIEKRAITQTMKQTTKREVLLIEDNKDMVDQYRRLLQREGFDVQTADHPAYAEAMVSNLRPTLLIMDVNFANGEGWNILTRLKQRDDTFDIPILVSSVNADAEEAYQIGAHHYIHRPFTNEELIEAVLDAEKESQRERILIIDDQPESVRLIEQLLNDEGNYRIFSAGNGTEGISLVARRQPNLIILDLRMPEKDGFAVLSELRSNPETAEIPVMVVTGEINLSADEQQQLANVHVLQKTNISETEFEQFINDIRQHLTGENGSQ